MRLKYDDLSGLVEKGLYALDSLVTIVPKTPIPDGVLLGDFIVRGGSVQITDREDASLTGLISEETVSNGLTKFLEMQGGATEFYDEFGDINPNIEDFEAEIVELAAFGKIVYDE